MSSLPTYRSNLFLNEGYQNGVISSPTFDTIKLELRFGRVEFAENNIEKPKEKNMNLKINLLSQELKQVLINEEEKTVTAISEKTSLCISEEPKKIVTQSHCHKDDEFDPYVGVALAIAYNLFGSKNNFQKFVENEAKSLAIINEKKEEARIAQIEREKLEAIKKAEEEHLLQLERLAYLRNAKVSELRELAKKQGIKNYWLLKKEQLLKEVK